MAKKFPTGLVITTASVTSPRQFAFTETIAAWLKQVPEGLRKITNTVHFPKLTSGSFHIIPYHLPFATLQIGVRAVIISSDFQVTAGRSTRLLRRQLLPSTHILRARHPGWNLRSVTLLDKLLAIRIDSRKEGFYRDVAQATGPWKVIDCADVKLGRHIELLIQHHEPPLLALCFP